MKGYKQIGKGSFSTVYRKGNANKVLIISNDSVKECMSFGWFPSSRLFPKVKFVGEHGDNKMYEMKYYHKITAPKKQLDKRAYELYRVLREIKSKYSINPANKGFTWINALKELPTKFNREKQALIKAVESLMNYDTNVAFEISPRNIARTANNKLVLLDCFFFPGDL